MCGSKPVFPSDGLRKSDIKLQDEYTERLNREVAEDILRQEAPAMYAVLTEYRTLVREFIDSGRLKLPETDLTNFDQLDQRASDVITNCVERSKSMRTKP